MDTTKTYGRPIAGASVTVAYTGTAGTTEALSKDAKAIRVIATTACFIEIGLDPTAVADTGMYLPAGIPEYFDLLENAKYFGGQAGIKVSAIQVSSGGSIYVTPF